MSSDIQQLEKKQESNGSTVSFSFEDIVAESLTLNASDIYIVPKADCCRVLFRIDTMLVEMPGYLMNVEQGAAFIKAMMNEAAIDQLKTATTGKIVYEKLGVEVCLEFTPDGRQSQRHVDISAKTVLTRREEFSETLGESLFRLGFDPDDLPVFESVIRRKGGLIVVSGTANSGMATTIRHMLTAVSESRKIDTIEDPIEYVIDMPNIVQHQICEPDRSNLGMDYESYIKSFRRSNCDVVLVDKWRREAGISRFIVDMADSGQLVFTTLHMNSPFKIYSKLEEQFSIPAKISAELVLMSLNQSVLPKLCWKCRIPEDIVITNEDIKNISDLTREDMERLKDLHVKGYKRNEDGCPECHHGFKGVTIVYSYFTPTDNLIRDIVKDNLSPYEIMTRTTAGDNVGRTKISVLIERIREGLLGKASLFEI